VTLNEPFFSKNFLRFRLPLSTTGTTGRRKWSI